MIRPELPPELKQQLLAIESSKDHALECFPCDVVVKDGKRIDCVYLVSEIQYIRYWGVFPEEDPGKRGLDVRQVLSVKEGRSRLPARFADKLYAHGESGMGYYIFTVMFDSGLRQAYLTGGAVDFIPYPE